MVTNRFRSAGAMLAIFAGMACSSTAVGQTAPLASHDVAFQLSSGPVALAGAIEDGGVAQLAWSQEIAVPGSSWLRLRFDEVVLAGNVEAGNNAYMVITSMLDGYRHVLNANTIRDWENTSAYMNGDTVVVELFVVPGTGASSVRMSEVVAGDPVPVTPETICGTTDDRTPLSDPRAARLMPIGCTAWLISANGNANEFLTAGHCFGTTNAVVQFAVPLSSSSGSTINPPPEFQFPVQASSVQSTQTGDDAARFFTTNNSNTGLSARVAMGGSAYILSNAPAASNQTMRITGYGTGGSAGNTWSQFGKTHTGPYTGKSGTQLQYRVDTTGGNSGSPCTIIGVLGIEFAIGIHTNGGCGTSTTSFNNGTDVAFSTLQGWLANPAGTATAYSGQICRSTVLASNNGGSVGGAVYFDAVVGSSDIEVNSMLMNLSPTTTQYTYDVYITAGGFAGKANTASAWTQIGSGGGIVNPEDTFSPAPLFDTFTLNANTTYGMAIVLTGAAHEYTNGDGTNQTFATGSGELTLNFGSASNVPFTGEIADRVWNGRMCFNVLTTSTCAEEVTSLATGMTEIDMDSLALGNVSVAALNNAGTPYDGSISAVSAPDKPSVTGAGVYNTNIAFGRALARVGGTMRIIINSGGESFDNTTFDVRLSNPTTEFGVEIGDYAGTLKVTFVNGNTPVATVISSAQSAAGAKLFRATCAFNRVLIDVDAAGGNFVITELIVPNNCLIAEINNMTVPAAEIDMDSLPLGTVSIAALNTAGTPNDAIVSAISMPTKSTATAGIYDTNVAFGRALARVSGVRNIINNNGTAAFDAVTYDVTFNRNVTQFGAEIGDYNGNLVVRFLDAGDNVVGVATSTSSTGTAGAIFFRSTCPFRSVEIDVSGTGGNFVITELWTEAAPANCYADCDGNGTLNIFDYICFGNAYSASAPYADCDGNGSFNIFDYICFGNAYAAGCP